MGDPPNKARKRQDRKLGLFTDRYIKSLKPQAEIYQIREGRGFAIRVLPSGVKSWYYVYSINGKRRQICLGNYPDVTLEEAHTKYRKAVDQVKSGIDPLRKQAESELAVTEPSILTVFDLKRLYLKQAESYLVPRSVTQQSRTLERDVIPAIGNMPAAEIRRKDAIALVEEVAKRAPGQARNVIKTARAMFSFAHDRELVDVNPFARVGRAVPSTAPKSRERTLSSLEIKQIWEALRVSAIGRAILMVLVTAQRPGEVSGMAWSEVTVGVGKTRCEICRRCGWWSIPSERTKTRDGEHRVYLTDLALSLLPMRYDDFVYPANGRGRGIGASGGMRPATMSHFITDNNYFGLPRWTPHDLRRTARTEMSALEIPERHAEAVLNHRQTGIKKVYDRHKYDKQKESALKKWTDRLKKLLA